MDDVLISASIAPASGSDARSFFSPSSSLSADIRSFRRMLIVAVVQWAFVVNAPALAFDNWCVGTKM